MDQPEDPSERRLLIFPNKPSTFLQYSPGYGYGGYGGLGGLGALGGYGAHPALGAGAAFSPYGGFGGMSPFGAFGGMSPYGMPPYAAAHPYARPAVAAPVAPVAAPVAPVGPVPPVSGMYPGGLGYGLRPRVFSPYRSRLYPSMAQPLGYGHGFEDSVEIY